MMSKTFGTQGKIQLNLNEELDHYEELLKIVVQDTRIMSLTLYSKHRIALGMHTIHRNEPPII
jgi:hypothetical protein